MTLAARMIESLEGAALVGRDPYYRAVYQAIRALERTEADPDAPIRCLLLGLQTVCLERARLAEVQSERFRRAEVS